MEHKDGSVELPTLRVAKAAWCVCASNVFVGLGPLCLRGVCLKFIACGKAHQQPIMQQTANMSIKYIVSRNATRNVRRRCTSDWPGTPLLLPKPRKCALTRSSPDGITTWPCPTRQTKTQTTCGWTGRASAKDQHTGRVRDGCITHGVSDFCISVRAADPQWKCATARLAPRVHAKACAERTGIGGWLPELRLDGTRDMWKARWFSLELTQENGPWIFAEGNKPSLVIPTLDSLAVLMGLKFFFGGALRTTAHVYRSRRREWLGAEQTDDHELSL